ncbi:proline rich protein 5MeD [Colletotrichum scovillei]|uniref:proline rich protein 5MeD n=1 Tax=Colletotrichum scovillei TaxID=1209932 RepID=UPI0015C38177|nr:proline rich protein 5MeD [Colletotrichum scovillei]KAF4779161.1 proline rich protein 5MeD [Colletotrichum scovillei]
MSTSTSVSTTRSSISITASLSSSSSSFSSSSWSSSTASPTANQASLVSTTSSTGSSSTSGTSGSASTTSSSSSSSIPSGTSSSSVTVNAASLASTTSSSTSTTRTSTSSSFSSSSGSSSSSTAVASSSSTSSTSTSPSFSSSSSVSAALNTLLTSSSASTFSTLTRSSSSSTTSSTPSSVSLQANTLASTSSSSSSTSTSATTTSTPGSASSSTAPTSSSSSRASSTSSSSSSSTRSTTSTSSSSSSSSSSTSTSSSSSRVVASATQGPAFSCPTTGFLIQSLTLFSLNLATGERTQIADNIGGDSTRNINALGYNAREDYLYGISQNEAATDFKIIRILANGTGTYVATVSKLTTGLFNSGDIDENGQYWISTGGADFYQYNFAPGTANYGGLVTSGKLTGTGGYTIGDWTVVPGVGGGDLWSVGVSNQVAYLLRWSRTSHAFTVVRNLGNLTGATGTTVPFWGASYATTDGYLFAVENGSGQIWRIAVDGSSNPLRLKDAPVSSRNDGARCLDSGAIVVSG